MNRSIWKFLWQSTLAVYWLALFVATHLPASSPLLPRNVSDKLLHGAAYAVLAVLFAGAWQSAAGRLTLAHLRWVWIVLVLYGGIDELLQIPVRRKASVGDWIADALGAAAGLALFAWINKRRRERTAVGE
jgi:VanZ family protein